MRFGGFSETICHHDSQHMREDARGNIKLSEQI